MMSVKDKLGKISVGKVKVKMTPFGEKMKRLILWMLMKLMRMHKIGSLKCGI
jgi:hypothetical protein